VFHAPSGRVGNRNTDKRGGDDAMSRGRFMTRLAILAIPMTLSVAGAGAPWAEADSVPAEEEPCKNVVLSLVPISLCRYEP
jgi:hypothetical protein